MRGCLLSRRYINIFIFWVNFKFFTAADTPIALRLAYSPLWYVCEWVLNTCNDGLDGKAIQPKYSVLTLLLNCEWRPKGNQPIMSHKFWTATVTVPVPLTVPLPVPHHYSIIIGSHITIKFNSRSTSPLN